MPQEGKANCFSLEEHPSRWDYIGTAKPQNHLKRILPTIVQKGQLEAAIGGTGGCSYLHVVLKAARHVVVDHSPHVALVQAHAKGHRRNHLQKSMRKLGK